MVCRLVNLGNGFWNIRCTMKFAGLINLGTQVSIVRLNSGRFVFLDSYALHGEIRDLVMALTKDGSLVEAVLNLHPFHTLHCEAMARDFPNARFYGSERHHRQCPAVFWQTETVESDTVAEIFGDDLQFSLPAGIDYISEDEKVHAGSLLAFHPASGSIHVDDTLNILPVPHFMRGRIQRLTLHPSLQKALTSDDGAAEDFCAWLEVLGRRWSNARTLCAAHNGVLRFGEGEFEQLARTIAARARAKLIA